MDAFNAICVPVTAACMRVSAGSASCGHAQRRPDGAHNLWPVERLLHRSRSRRSRSTISCRARRSSRSGPPAAIWPANSARTGIFRSARTRPRPDHALPEAIAQRRGGNRLPHRRLYLQRSRYFSRIRDRRRAGLPRARHQDSRGHAPAISARSPGANFSVTWTPPMSISRVLPRASTKDLRSRAGGRA